VQVCKVQVEMVQATWGDCVVNDGPGTALAMGVYHACLGYTHAFGQRSRQLEFSEAALPTWTSLMACSRPKTGSTCQTTLARAGRAIGPAKKRRLTSSGERFPTRVEIAIEI
jgi:hypothetical protein